MRIMDDRAILCGKGGIMRKIDASRKAPIQLSIVVWLYAIPIVIFLVYILPLIINNIIIIINNRGVAGNLSSLLILSWYPIVSLVVILMLTRHRGGIVIARWLPIIDGDDRYLI